MNRYMIAAIAMLLLVPGAVRAKVRIVASTTDLASIARMVGGDHVDVESIARGNSDPHYVEVLPSYMIKVKRADIYLMVGMDMDRWARPIIDGSRNGDLIVVDCSRGITPLNVPTQRIDASMGDVHPQGNPHYWLNPANGIVVAEAIVNALNRVDAGNSADYQAGLERFSARIQEKEQEWIAIARRLEGVEIVTYHDTWPYFTQAFGIGVAGFVEPKPGIEPTPSHTAAIVELVRARDIKVIGVEPYFNKRTPESIARQTGASVVEMPTSVGGSEGVDDYFALFDKLLNTLAAAEGR